MRLRDQLREGQTQTGLHAARCQTHALTRGHGGAPCADRAAEALGRQAGAFVADRHDRIFDRFVLEGRARFAGECEGDAAGIGRDRDGVQEQVVERGAQAYRIDIGRAAHRDAGHDAVAPVLRQAAQDLVRDMGEHSCASKTDNEIT